MSEKDQIFQKKTIEAAVNTIMTKMDELEGANESDKNIMRRRWIWELMQNANDCANEKEISIWINSNENELVFSHNGDIFTYDNLIDLITQISSKRTNEDKTGKFGTGFISTHLISEIVTIKGIYHRTQTSNNYKSMCFDIDRSGETEQEIKDSITTAISELETIDMSENVECDIDRDDPKTSFVYDLTWKSSFEVQKAIGSGYKDLDMSIGFVLAFTRSIKEVHCDGITYRRNRTSLINDSLEVIDVVKWYDDGHKEPEIKQILVCTEKTIEVSVATLIEYRENNYYTCTMKDVPKLFCTFPLIGTENFSFPVVLNSPKLKVLQERNHIQEGAEINREIIDIAISLYERMLDYACGNKWNSLYNICYMNNSKESSWQKAIFERIESIYQIRPVVDVQAKAGQMSKESLYKIENEKLRHNIFIPSMDKNELNDRLWDIINCLNIKIATRESFKQWLAISPNNRITLQMIYSHLLKDKSVSDLSLWLKNKTEVVSWLNKLYDLWINSSDEQNFKATAIVPNQNGQFVEITKVAIDNNIDDVLKEILTLLGTDIKRKLMYKRIEIIKGSGMNSYSNEYVANKISDHIRKQLSDESSNTIKRASEVQNIFNTLTDWFLKNPDLAKPLFKDIYDKQHLLSSPEETIRRLEIASSVESAMNENNIELEQLGIVLKESGRLLQMFENGEISLSENAKELFQHISSKSLYAKEKLDYLIGRSICSVHKELVDNSLYSVEDSLEEWKQNKYSTTVFKARKENKDIRIVIRPSDGDKIILYEDAEIEALDDTDYELWTDNGDGIVRMITLGDLIKTIGISLIPLRKIL
ncbi:sacsin N-terminal ATP-binding-like domain-containing protein [Shouchella clausii]|uniref:sacsin N-terminal ATP-binding-like domain-containing protein n=1 Tax=Shouchella clausii TaxID=79880 RepID=UPI000791DAC7|nr:hypothetical protein [Shouchella clausii]KKI86577.1 hypothetical protein WZ76_09055 [Shouchella clausii]